MLASKHIRLIAIGLVALLALVLLLCPSDEKKVREAADAIVKGANQDAVELGRALEQYAVEDVSVTISDLAEPLQGRGALVRAAERARVNGQKLRFRMEAVEI